MRVAVALEQRADRLARARVGVQRLLLEMGEVRRPLTGERLDDNALGLLADARQRA